ncbi:cation:proton antiporter [Histidinibacterium aquaticum]|uniref:Sodium:proton antiporter n=1 Tax=Histidinibacterium aquaticum TaxID=2613962 RepID=A0A5J5GDP8_9RHOB|nr:cation:proton antiporter [Histidinibacterium aquaticum]KAA9005584.1 sodium:proton antiporter [Histidinibacterium aquaticum]
MQHIHSAIVISGLVVIVLGLLSGPIKRSVLSIPLLATLMGLLAGPEVLGWLNVDAWHRPEEILKQAARFTLAVSVTGIAIRTPTEDLRKLARPVLILLSFGMLAMWGLSSVAAWLALGLPLASVLLLGAIVTPTDPVAASSIVNGAAAEHSLPDRLRSTLSLESGANDGLGYLLVMLPLLAITGGWDGGTLREWLVDVVLIGVILAVALGALMGLALGTALRRADEAGLVEEHSLLSLTVALSLVALAGAKLVGSDGILAAFAAGAAFNASVERQERLEEENVQEAILKLFNLPVFVLFGAMLPWAGWVSLGWAGLGFGLLVLVLRRPPTLALLGPVLGAGLRARDAVFLGWFGPMGVAAIYYALHAKAETGEAVLWHAASLAVALSVVAHGVTASLGMRLYDRAAEASDRSPEGRHAPSRSG